MTSFYILCNFINAYAMRSLIFIRINPNLSKAVCFFHFLLKLEWTRKFNGIQKLRVPVRFHWIISVSRQYSKWNKKIWFLCFVYWLWQSMCACEPLQNRANEFIFPTDWDSFITNTYAIQQHHLSFFPIVFYDVKCQHTFTHSRTYVCRYEASSLLFSLYALFTGFIYSRSLACSLCFFTHIEVFEMLVYQLFGWLFIYLFFIARKVFWYLCVLFVYVERERNIPQIKLCWHQ